MNIICFGDSITEAAEVSPEARWTSLLQRDLDSWQEGAFTVHNRGMGGHTSGEGFDRLHSDVLPLLPGLLLVQFGFNDANVRDWAMAPRVGLPEFKKNLREFHRVAHARGGRCVFIVNHTIGQSPGRQGNGKNYQDNLRPYNRAIRKLAEELDAAHIDLPLIMAQQHIELSEFLAEDALHLSAAGNRIYAAMILEALRPLLSEPIPAQENSASGS